MCKHVFVQKTNAGRQSTKANARVEILIAIALLTHCFSGVCIATKQKGNNLQNTSLCQKQQNVCKKSAQKKTVSTVFFAFYLNK